MENTKFEVKVLGEAWTNDNVANYFEIRNGPSEFSNSSIVTRHRDAINPSTVERL